MLKLSRTLFLAAAVLGLAGLTFTPTAAAGLLTISITDVTKGGTFTVQDGSGNDTDAATNSVSITDSAINGFFGAGTVGGATLLSANSNNAGTPSQAFVVLQTLFAPGTGNAPGSGDVFSIEASQNDFILPPGPAHFLNSSATANFVDAAGTSTSGAGYANGANVLFSHLVSDGPLGPFAPATNNSTAFAANGTSNVPFSGTPFSITADLLQNTNPSGTITGSITVNVTDRPASVATPEPSTLAGAGLAGLVGLAIARRRRKAT